MDELSKAYEKFYPSTSGGMSAGSSPPPGPSGDPSFFHPAQLANEYQSDPGTADTPRESSLSLTNYDYSKDQECIHAFLMEEVGPFT